MYRGPLHCARTIVRVEGVRGLYQGLIPNLIGVTPEKAIKLAVNDLAREVGAPRARIRAVTSNDHHCECLAASTLSATTAPLHCATRPCLAQLPAFARSASTTQNTYLCAQPRLHAALCLVFGSGDCHQPDGDHQDSHAACCPGRTQDKVSLIARARTATTTTTLVDSNFYLSMQHNAGCASLGNSWPVPRRDSDVDARHSLLHPLLPRLRQSEGFVWWRGCVKPQCDTERNHTHTHTHAFAPQSLDRSNWHFTHSHCLVLALSTQMQACWASLPLVA